MSKRKIAAIVVFIFFGFITYVFANPAEQTQLKKNQENNKGNEVSDISDTEQYTDVTDPFAGFTGGNNIIRTNTSTNNAGNNVINSTNSNSTINNQNNSVNTNATNNTNNNVNNGNDNNNSNNNNKPIDDIAPTAVITYSPDTLTNGNVMATITFSEAVKQTGFLNSWLKKSDTVYQKAYPMNTTQNLEFEDLAGNKGTTELKIDWIDKVAPFVINMKQVYESKEGGRVKVTVTFSEEIKAPFDNLNWRKISDTEYYTYFYRTKDYNINFEDLAGNKGNYTINVDMTTPKITPTLINGEAGAKIVSDGKRISLAFTSDKELDGIPEVTIAGIKANVVSTGNNSYRAVIIVNSTAPEGQVEFTITGKDLIGNPVTFTSNVDNKGNYIIIDRTAPTVDVTIVNGESNAIYITKGKRISVTFTANEELKVLPEVIIAGVKANVVSLGNNSYRAVSVADANSPEGKVEFSINTIDIAGNSSTTIKDEDKAGRYVVIDNIKPTIEVIKPNEKDYINNTNVKVEAKATDNEKVAKIVANLYNSENKLIKSSTSTVDNAVATHEYDFSNLNLADGEYYYKVNALDAAGNMSSTIIRKFIVDSTKPIVKVNLNRESYVTSGAIVKSTSIPEYEAYDENLTRIVIFDEENKIVNNIEVNDVKNRRGKLTHLKEGTYKIVAYDKANNESDSFILIIDNTKPNVQVVTPNEDQYLNNSDVNVEVKATDNVNVAKIVANLYDSTGKLLKSSQSNINSKEGIHKYDFSSLNLADGEYYFRINALDAAGNMSSTIKRDFIVDSTKPELKINLNRQSYINSGDYIRSNQIPEFEATDSNLSKVIIYKNDGSILSTAQANGATSRRGNIKHLTDGTYKLVAYDKAGNKSDDFIITIDNLTPTVDINYSTKNPTNKAVTVTLTFSEKINPDNLPGTWLKKSDTVYQKVYPANSTQNIEFSDMAGNKGNATIKIDWINKSLFKKVVSNNKKVEEKTSTEKEQIKEEIKEEIKDTNEEITDVKPTESTNVEIEEEQ